MTTRHTRHTQIGPVEVSGSPSPDEVAAIVAAIEMSWPKPLPAATAPRQTSTRWRHAARWWADGRLPNGWS